MIGKTNDYLSVLIKNTLNINYMKYGVGKESKEICKKS
jgi:hypothetical protein